MSGVMIALGPTQVHPHKHLGEVGRIDAACSRTNGYNGFTLVVLPRQQSANLKGIEVRLNMFVFTPGLSQRVRVIVFLAHLDENLKVINARPHGCDTFKFVLGRR